MPSLHIGAVALLTDPVRGVLPHSRVLIVGDSECVVPQRSGLHDHPTSNVSGSGIALLAAVIEVEGLLTSSIDQAALEWLQLDIISYRTICYNFYIFFLIRY